MDVIRHITSHPRRFDAPVLTLGNFDGVHRGHQAILARVVSEARQGGNAAVAMTGGQAALILGTEETGVFSAADAVIRAVRPAIQLLVVLASAEEVEAHERYLGLLDTASGVLD